MGRRGPPSLSADLGMRTGGNRGGGLVRRRNDVLRRCEPARHQRKTSPLYRTRGDKPLPHCVCHRGGWILQFDGGDSLLGRLVLVAASAVDCIPGSSVSFLDSIGWTTDNPSTNSPAGVQPCD